jgi:hypothetical protein
VPDPQVKSTFGIEEVAATIGDALRSFPAPVVNVTHEKPRAKLIERDENGDISRIVEE